MHYTDDDIFGVVTATVESVDPGKKWIVVYTNGNSKSFGRPKRLKLLVNEGDSYFEEDPDDRDGAYFQYNFLQPKTPAIISGGRKNRGRQHGSSKSRRRRTRKHSRRKRIGGRR